MCPGDFQWSKVDRIKAMNLSALLVEQDGTGNT